MLKESVNSQQFWQIVHDLRSRCIWMKRTLFFNEIIDVEKRYSSLSDNVGLKYGPSKQGSNRMSMCGIQIWTLLQHVCEKFQFEDGIIIYRRKTQSVSSYSLFRVWALLCPILLPWQLLVLCSSCCAMWKRRVLISMWLSLEMPGQRVKELHRFAWEPRGCIGKR